MGRSASREKALSETRKYRKFTAQQKTEIVLASLRGPKTVAELCREHDIADSLLRKWREQFLAAGAERLDGRQERTEADELRRQIARLLARGGVRPQHGDWCPDAVTRVRVGTV
jgi:transposase